MVLPAPDETVPPRAIRLSALGPMTAVAAPRTRLPEPSRTLPVWAFTPERLSVPEPPMVNPTNPAVTDPVMLLLMVSAPVEPAVLAVIRIPSLAPKPRTVVLEKLLPLLPL